MTIAGHDFGANVAWTAALLRPDRFTAVFRGQRPVSAARPEFRRQLQRVCAECSGLSPKHLARIIRFRHAAALLRGASTDLPAVVMGAGYFEQSHMNRDSRELAAMTPAEYARVQIRAYKCLVSDFSKPLNHTFLWCDADEGTPSRG